MAVVVCVEAFLRAECKEALANDKAADSAQTDEKLEDRESDLGPV